jgi:hypothetical protein
MAIDLVLVLPDTHARYLPGFFPAKVYSWAAWRFVSTAEGGRARPPSFLEINTCPSTTSSGSCGSLVSK